MRNSLLAAFIKTLHTCYRGARDTHKERLLIATSENLAAKIEEARAS